MVLPFISRSFAKYKLFLKILLVEFWIFREIFNLATGDKLIKFALTFSTVEHADTSFTAVMDLVPSENWITLSLDPNTSHCIIKNLVLFKQTKA